MDILVFILLLLLSGCSQHHAPMTPASVPVPAPMQSPAYTILRLNDTQKIFIADEFPNAQVLDIGARQFVFDLNGTNGDPTIIPGYWDAGKSILRNAGYADVADKADGALPLLVFIFMETDGINSQGQPYFNVEGLELADKVVLANTVNHGPLDPLIRIYFLVDDPKHIVHETGHAAWIHTRPNEQCPDPSMGRTNSWVGHGGPCDPLNRVN